MKFVTLCVVVAVEILAPVSRFADHHPRLTNFMLPNGVPKVLREGSSFVLSHVKHSFPKLCVEEILF